MKNLGVILFVLCLLQGYGQEKPAYKIFKKDGKAVKYSKVLKEVLEQEVVCFGELHNNPISHWLQYELMIDLYANKGRKLSLGAEMFEADNQYILNEYMNDKISARNFNNEVRLWPNYDTDYKPLVEFAKANDLKFVATNIPRRYANIVYRKGMEGLNDLDSMAYINMVPLDEFKYDSTVACYAALSGNVHGGGNLGMSQAIKDATMAYFIDQYVKKGRLFCHFNGAYHSDNHEGIVWYLKNVYEHKKIITITTVEQTDINTLSESNMNKADFIICVPETMTKTH